MHDILPFMANMERRKLQEVGPLSGALARFPVEKLDDSEIEVFTSAQAHIQELEEIARRKGIELNSESNKEDVVEEYSVKLGELTRDVSRLGKIYKENVGAGVVIIKADGTKAWQQHIERDGGFLGSRSYDKRIEKSIKKANKLADKLNNGLIK
jgi:hypothetical protein